MKPTIPEVLDRFKTYHAEHPTWGSLHIVLDDLNVSDSNVAFCAVFAAQEGDTEGQELAQLLLQMSKTQRLKLSRLA